MKSMLLMILLAGVQLLTEAQDTTWLERGYLALTPTAKIDCFTRSLELEVPTTETYFSRAAAFLESGNYQAAIDDYSSMILLDSIDPGAFFTRGFARQLYARDYSGALADYTAALRLDSDNAYYLILAGLASSILRDYPTAIARFRNAIATVEAGTSTIDYMGGASMSGSIVRGSTPVTPVSKTLCDYIPSDLNDARLGLASALLFSGDHASALRSLQEPPIDLMLLDRRIHWFKPCDSDPAVMEQNDRLLMQLADELHQ